MRRLLGLILLVSFSLTSAQKGKGREPGVPEFDVFTPVYPGATIDSVKLKVLIKIPYSSVQFLKQGSIFVAEFEMAVMISDKDEKLITQNRWKRRIESEDYEETIARKPLDLETRSFVLSLGKFICKIEVKDLDTHKSGKKSIELELDDFGGEVVLSDLMLVNQMLIHEQFSHGVPIIPPKITGSDTSFTIFYQARLHPGEYTLSLKSISSDGDILSEKVVNGFSDGHFISDIVKLPVEHVARKKFKVEAILSQDGMDSQRELLVEVKWSGLPTQVEDLEAAIEQLRYIASSKTYKKIAKTKGEEQEQLFRDFWENRDPTPGTKKNELMNEYYKRVSYANEKFGSFQDGWKSSMGMIYILFGTPDDVQYTPYGLNGRAYQRWYYYKINRSFQFVDRNGFGDYELVEPYFPFGSD
ncbi:MAG: GWxTD domain-containing protein [Fidelibacterota bacterium]